MSTRPIPTTPLPPPTVWDHLGTFGIAVLVLPLLVVAYLLMGLVEWFQREGAGR